MHCKFKKDGWECPLSAEEKGYCYWHLQKDGKSPSDEKLKELKENEIMYAYLVWADLEEADLRGANLQGASLWQANLRGAKLSHANLQRANLALARINSDTALDGADLSLACLCNSYIDETRTLRNATIGEYDIHEVVADLIGKVICLDFGEIKREEPELASKLTEYYVKDIRILLLLDVILFDVKEKKVVNLAFEEKEENIKSKLKKELVEVPELTESINEFVLKIGKKVLYDAAYEVYNNLYYFYIQNGRLDEALKMHYRRSEVRRKALKFKGKGIKRMANWLRSWIYDFFILKTLTGYGVKILRPLLASLVIILMYAFLFWLTNGIVKFVNGKEATPDFIDYIYHSVITFTSLGYANIQPNLAGHIPQFLAASESCLGALMIALLIFTITFRVSR